MKKKLAILLVLMMVFVFSGCMRVNMQLNVHDDGTGDLSMLYAVYTAMDDMLDDMEDPESTDEYSDDITDDAEQAENSVKLAQEDIDALEAQGYQYEEYSKDGYEGYTIKTENMDLTKLFSGTEITGVDDSEFVITKNGTQYTIDWVAFNDSESSEIDSVKEYFDSYDGYMRFVLTLPVAAGENNASEVTDGGKTLTWNLLDINGESVHAEFELPEAGNGSPSTALIALVIAAIIVVIAVVIVLTRKKPNAAQTSAAVAAGESSPDSDSAKKE